MKKVNCYVNVVTNQIKQENIFHHIYLYAARRDKVKVYVNSEKVYENYSGFDGEKIYKSMGKTKQISHLHTGSIPSQFGKPLMTLGEISPSMMRSHLEMASDHDVMIVLDNMPVLEVRGTNII